MNMMLIKDMFGITYPQILLVKNQKECFFINKESAFVQHFLDDFDDKDKRKILNFIDAVSSSIPFDDIYNSVCNKNNATELEDEQLESIILEGIAQFKRIKSIIQCILIFHSK